MGACCSSENPSPELEHMEEEIDHEVAEMQAKQEKKEACKKDWKKVLRRFAKQAILGVRVKVLIVPLPQDSEAEQQFIEEPDDMTFLLDTSLDFVTLSKSHFTLELPFASISDIRKGGDGEKAACISAELALYSVVLETGEYDLVFWFPPEEEYGPESSFALRDQFDLCMKILRKRAILVQEESARLHDGNNTVENDYEYEGETYADTMQQEDQYEEVSYNFES
eukprot:Platyproteum_vivax@DN5407_c0_g1_i1.p1